MLGSLDLNEAKLNEADGIGSLKETIWRLPNGTLCTSDGDYEIDWNWDGVYSDFVRVNVNNHPSLGYKSVADENLTDYDDWGNLVYNLGVSWVLLMGLILMCMLTLLLSLMS